LYFTTVQVETFSAAAFSRNVDVNTQLKHLIHHHLMILKAIICSD